MAAFPEKLLLAAPRGYCAGVDRAVQTVERALELHGAPVYVRKEIVHNKHVVEQLRDRGAVFVEELDDSIPEGAVTVFSAHGVSPAVHADALARGLQTIDATCPLVTKVHREALKFAGEGYTIVLIGHSGHEEVEGTMGEAPEHIVLVETEEDVDRLEVADPERIAYISQTTLSVDETRAIIARLRERFPAIIGPRTDDICYATTNRQAAVKQMAPQCDLVLVIGSRNSSNSNRLVEVSRELGTDAHLIDTETQVQESWLEGRRVVGITSGAQRARDARAAPRRVLPRARHEGRRGVPGRPGGRPLHAPQDDPPGAGGAVRLGVSGQPGADLRVVLAEPRRPPAHRGGRVVQAQRRAHRAHAVGVVPRLQAEIVGEREGGGDVVDRAGGDARLAEPRHPLAGRRGGERRLELGPERVAVGQARRVGREALVLGQLGAADGAAQAAEERVVAAGDGEVAVGGGERLVRRDARMAVAEPLADDARRAGRPSPG